jgi:hypothetical protein
VQRTLGPHGITLLRHADAGGEEAKAVAEYLESLGDADPVPPTVTLPPEELERCTGTYAFGDAEGERFEVTIDAKGALRIARADRSARFLSALGDGAFFPRGAEAVRIRFDPEGAKAASLSIYDPDVVVTARRL